MYLFPDEGRVTNMDQEVPQTDAEGLLAALEEAVEVLEPIELQHLLEHLQRTMEDRNGS